MVGGDNPYNKACSASAAEKEILILRRREEPIDQPFALKLKSPIARHFLFSKGLV
jgi:hypothetical protein